MASISPYLTFNQNCDEAFRFYRSVFGGEFQYVSRFKEMPAQDGKPFSPEVANLIMHISLPIGGGSYLMGCDDPGLGQELVAGNNFAISLKAGSRQEADRFFADLSQGGKATMPMNDSFWGSYFGMCTDRFGIQWMISFDRQVL